MKFVLLRGVIKQNFGQAFFTTHTEKKDPTRSKNGEIWYEIIGYADSVEEAQIKLYGRSYK